MPRPLRIEMPGAFYHVVNRGDRSEAIFLDEGDRESFVELLGKTCGKMGWRVHAYCLMPNHFHLVVETPQANLVSGMKWLLGTYSARVNRRHQLKGHLFAGRYRSVLFDGHSNETMRAMCDYVHLNPSRANLIPASEPLRSYRWSSLREYLATPSSRVGWLTIGRLLVALKLGETGRDRGEFEQRLESLRRAEPAEEWRQIRKDWCFGSDSFRQQLLDSAHSSIRRGGDAKARQEATEARAEAIIQEEFRAQNLGDDDLEGRNKGDPLKVAIARRLRQETSVTLKWIAHRLRMGTWTHTANCIYASRRRATASTKARPRTESRTRIAPVQEAVVETGVAELPIHCL